MRCVDAFLDRLQFLCELSEQGDIRELQRAAERGRLVRVHRGAYYPFEGWNKLTQTERYTFRVLAAVGTNRVNPTISHISAAVLHGAPIIGPMPTLVHMLATTAAGTRTEHGYRKHATDYPAEAIELRGELRLTDLSRTLAEVAADSPFLTAVGILDWAFANYRIGPADVSQMLDRLQIRRGRRRAVRRLPVRVARRESQQSADLGGGTSGAGVAGSVPGRRRGDRGGRLLVARARSHRRIRRSQQVHPG